MKMLNSSFLSFFLCLFFLFFFLGDLQAHLIPDFITVEESNEILIEEKQRGVTDLHKRISKRKEEISMLDESISSLERSLRYQEDQLKSKNSDYDQLRNSAFSEVTLPTLNTYLTYLNHLKGIKEFSLGYGHSLLLTDDGQVYSWGLDEKGQLGLIYPHDRHSPKLAQFLDDKNIKAFSNRDFGLRDFFTLEDDDSKFFPCNWVRTIDDKTYWPWCGNSLDPPGPVGILYLLDENENHILTDDNKIFFSNRNTGEFVYLGELGTSDPINRHSPSLVTTLDEKTITQLSTQDFDKHHSVVMDRDGKVYSWGQNNHGQLGFGDTLNRYVPEEITFFADKTLIQISLGKAHSLALDHEGQVYSWGWNEDGQLGFGDKEKKLMPSFIPYFKENGIYITQVTTSYKHNLALDKDGQVYSWGCNDHGELGLSHNEDRLSPALILYFKDNGIKIIKLAIGSWHSFAIDDKGHLYSWGRNYNGRLGHRDEVQRNEPTLINYFSDNNIIITDIIAGCDHSIALDDKGNLYSWGGNYRGELGFGDNKHRNIPTLVSSFKDKKITEIYSGTFHNIVKTDEGEVYVWGQNNHGQLGLGESKTQEDLRNAEVFSRERKNNLSHYQESGGYKTTDSMLKIFEDPYNKRTHIQGGDFSHNVIEVTGGTIHLSNLSMSAREIYIYLTGKEGQISLINCRINTPRLVILSKDQSVTIEQSHFDLEESLKIRLSQEDEQNPSSWSKVVPTVLYGSKARLNIDKETEILIAGKPYDSYDNQAKNLHLIKKEEEVINLFLSHDERKDEL